MLRRLSEEGFLTYLGEPPELRSFDFVIRKGRYTILANQIFVGLHAGFGYI